MIDLLNPSGLNLRDHYLHLLKQTVSAYNPTQVVLGEALQNAIDAIVQANGSEHKITVKLNFDQRSVTVADDGVGFPNDPNLLFLGGGRKRHGDRKLFGFVGVGLKVVVFSSKNFCLRAHSGDGAFHYEIQNAYKFDSDSPPSLQVPEVFPKDPSPSALAMYGTEVNYQFPSEVAHDPFKLFIQDISDRCLPHGIGQGFGKTLQEAVDRRQYETRFAGLMASYLRRYTYAGDVWKALGGKLELQNTTINVEVILVFQLNLLIYRFPFGILPWKRRRAR